MPPATMRAARYTVNGPPSVLKVESTETPKPGPNEVLMKVEFAAINVVDAKIRSGHYPTLHVPLPAIPGKDASGVVAEVGASVKSYKVGDRVLTSSHGFRSGGTYAEYHVAREEELFHLPDNYSMEEGAALGGPYYTAARAIFHAGQAKPGDVMFVHGASGQAGVACVQLGAAYGMIVYGTAGTEEGLRKVVDCGAKAAFNHREANYLDNVKAAIGPKGPDVIIEMVATTNLQSDLELIGKRGRIVIVGGDGPPTSISAVHIMAKESIVTAVKVTDATPDEFKEMATVIRDGLARGWIKPSTGKIYPFSEAVQAHEDIEKSTSSQGRLLLKI